MNSTLKTPARTAAVYLTRPEGRVGYDVTGSGTLWCWFPVRLEARQPLRKRRLGGVQQAGPRPRRACRSR